SGCAQATRVDHAAASGSSQSTEKSARPGGVGAGHPPGVCMTKASDAASAVSVEVFTDGACLGNPGPGGWAALLRSKGREKLLSGGDPDTTNNRMELSAAIMALEALKRSCSVSLTTDSRYVMQGIESWLPRWRANRWRTAAGKPVKNQ